MSQSTKPLISIVLVSWNGEAQLRQFLYSIAELRYAPLEVIIVDNGSRDGTVRYLEKGWPEYRIVSSRHNLGTAGGSNLGALAARGKYIFFTSNDMIYDPGLLDAM
ncbi:MAG: glycosyltransferase, partial [Desulfobacterales bacterium]|nr:glycosyltransferase [Desulfobacterales bacterium]